jgi:hypothetical protein
MSKVNRYRCRPILNQSEWWRDQLPSLNLARKMRTHDTTGQLLSSRRERSPALMAKLKEGTRHCIGRLSGLERERHEKEVKHAHRSSLDAVLRR